MFKEPRKIGLDEIGRVIRGSFQNQKYITCYLSNNAATPTRAIKALTDYIKSGAQMPFMRMVSLLLLGEVSYLEPGLQDKIMGYSIFSGPAVRKAINEGRAYYIPCTLANMENLIGRNRPLEPDIVIAKVTQHPTSGMYNFGPSLEAMHIAIDRAKMVIGILDKKMPYLIGGDILPSSIDYLVVDDDVEPLHQYVTDSERLPLHVKRAMRRAGELIVKHFIKDGATLQIGIGEITERITSSIVKAGFRNLGCQTEVFSDELMNLVKAGIITNRHKKVNPYYSTATVIIGSNELYQSAHMRSDIQMRSCTYTNAMETIRANGSPEFPFISINTAMGVDLGGNVWADYVDAERHWSGVGGQPDFIRALSDPQYGVAIIVMLSKTLKGDSKIVRTHPPGVTLTAGSYDNVVVVTEHGIADLRGLGAGCKARALAHVSDESVRDELLRYIYDNPRMFIAPRHTRKISGFIPYSGSTPLKE